MARSNRKRKGNKKKQKPARHEPREAPPPKSRPAPARGGDDAPGSPGGALERAAPWLVSILAVLLYAATVSYGFVLDDTAVIVKNDHVARGFSGIDLILSSAYWEGYAAGTPTFYRPMSLITFAIEQAVWEGPGLAHLNQVLLYGGSAAVVYGLVRALVGWWPALLTALLWVAHPVHSEVVANIKSRDELLALTLGVATLWLAHRGRLWWAVAAFIGAALCKESVLTFVLVLPAMLWMFRGELRSAWVTLPGLGVYFLLRLGATGTLLPVTPEHMLEPTHNALFAAETAVENLGTVLSIAGRYTELLLLPRTLVFDYSIGQLPVVSPTDPFAILGAVALAGLVGVVAWRRQGPVAFAAFYILATYTVISNAVLRIAGSTMAERYAFTPSLGVCLLAALALARLPRKAGGALVAVLVVAGAVRVADRLPDWGSDEALFAADVVTAPGNPRVVSHFATLRTLQPQDSTEALLLGAVAQWQEDPKRYHHAGAQANLALCRLHQAQGQLTEAVRRCEQAADIEPTTFEAAFHLGQVRYLQDRYAESATAYVRALITREGSPRGSADPTPLGVYTYNLGLSQLQAGDLLGARHNFQRTLDLDKRDAKAWAGLALVAERRGQPDVAQDAWRTARGIDPSL
jgi:protein O-mannosyl-transferase